MGEGISNMGEEILKQIEEIDQKIATYVREKIKLEGLIGTLKEKKKDLNILYNKKLADEQAHWETWTQKSFPWEKEVQSILKHKFGLQQFRPQQIAAINATLSKKDALLIMPTGGGKSLCYQLPAIVNSGMTLVISPLISLMEDQIYKMQKLDVVVYKLAAAESSEVKKAIFRYLNKAEGPPVKLLYISPEMLVKSKKLMAGLQVCHKAGNLNRIAIDEVHCCSEWGHDFRPDYGYLGLLRDTFKDVPVIGLTATATAILLNDIRNLLGIPTATIIKAPFDRPNLIYKVITKPQKLDSCIELLCQIIKSDFEGSCGIIYANTIKECEEVTRKLNDLNISAAFYHAQIDNTDKTKIYNRWMKNKYQIMVATIAFGLGIDKPDVRFVIHYSVPKSIEELYQQSGRAGRDGKPATCIVLFALGDYLKQLIYAVTKKEIERVSAVLKYILNIKDCRHVLIANCFEEDINISCKKNCDNCLREEGKVDRFSLERPCNEIYKVLDNVVSTSSEVTLIKLIDQWYKSFKVGISIDDGKLIIAHLLNKRYLERKKCYTAYTVIPYIIKSTTMSSETEKDYDVYMISTPTLRRYLGSKTNLPQNGIFSNRSKKRKIDETDNEPSTSKLTSS